MVDGLDTQTMKEDLSEVKGLPNMRHKNTLLRIWNGDCLSYTRLVHMGLVSTSTCPNCNALDMPMHTLIECDVAKQVWVILMLRIPKCADLPLLLYAIGIIDNRTRLSIKAEVMKILMHFRELSSESIYHRLTNNLLISNGNDRETQEILR
jgi:hypothetical protein